MTFKVKDITSLTSGIFFMFILSSSYLSTFAGDLNNGNVMKQIFFPVIAIIFLVLYFISPKKISAAALSIWCAVAIAPIVSLLWAYDGSASSGRSLLNFFVALSVFLMSRLRTWDENIDTITKVSLLVIGVSYLSVFFGNGVHTSIDHTAQNLVGDWHGIFPNKNTAGAFCAIIILLILQSGALTKTKILNIFIFLIFLINTSSKTSILLGVLSLLVTSIFNVLEKKRSHRGSPAIFFTIVALFLFCAVWTLSIVLEVYQYGGLIDLEAYTGRGYIWEASSKLILDSDFLGFGFGSVWLNGSGPLSQYSYYQWVSEIGSAHNGYLEVLMQFGMFHGCALLIFAIIIPASLYIKNPMRDDIYKVMLSITIFYLPYNLFESKMIDSDSISWVLYSIVVFQFISSKRIGGQSEEECI